MMRRRRQRAEPWTSAEVAILIDAYARGGLDEASDALPERSGPAITRMAAILKVRSPFAGKGRAPELQGAALDEAIRLHEKGWSFIRIGQRFGVSSSAATNAVLMTLCPRKGYVPAERDERGCLLPEGLDRLRAMLRDGRKPVDIQLELAVSSGRICLERRSMNAQAAERGEAPLPPPGGGARYSGAKITANVHREIERLLMRGLGAPKVAAATGVSKVQIGRLRNKLVRRLAKTGECLPGCDERGRRVAYLDSAAAVADVQKDILRAELMKGTPVARAAKIAVVGGTYAYRFRDELRAELERADRSLPEIVRLGRVKAEAVDRVLDWLPRKKKNLILYRRFLVEAGGDQLEAKRRTIAALMPKPTPNPAPPKRQLTWEEKLAAVARGELRVVDNIPLRRPDPTMTLGGIATGAL